MQIYLNSYVLFEVTGRSTTKRRLAAALQSGDCVAAIRVSKVSHHLKSHPNGCLSCEDSDDTK